VVSLTRITDLRPRPARQSSTVLTWTVTNAGSTSASLDAWQQVQLLVFLQ